MKSFFSKIKAQRKYLYLTILVVANLSIQFGFQWYSLVLLGPGDETDALFGAMALPSMILATLSGSLSMVLIPVFSDTQANKSGAGVWDFFCAIGLFFLCLAFLLYFTSSYWVSYLLPGFKGEKLGMAIYLSNLQLITMVLSALQSIVWGAYAAKDKFSFIEITSLLASSFALLLLFLLRGQINVFLISWIGILRSALQVLLLSRIIGKPRIPNFRSDEFRLVWKRLRPLIIGNLYYKTDPLIDRYFLSQSSTGKLTLFNLAQQMYSIGNTILVKIFVNTMIPGIVSAKQENNYHSAKLIFQKRLYSLLLVTLLIIGLIALFGLDILSFVFKYKNFSKEDVTSLWYMLLLMGGFWIGGALGSVTSSTFYSLGDTVTPTKIGAIAFTIFVPIKIFAFGKYGIIGLSIAISVYYICSFVIQFFYLRRKFTVYDQR